MKMKILTLTLLSSLMVMKVEGADGTKEPGTEPAKKLTFNETLALKKMQQKLAEQQALSASSANLASSVALPTPSLGASLLVDIEAREKAEQNVLRLTKELEVKETDLKKLEASENKQTKLVQQRESEIRDLNLELTAAKKTIKANEKKISELEEAARKAASSASSGSLTPPTSPSKGGSSPMPLTPSKASLESAERLKKENDGLTKKMKKLDADLLVKEKELSDAQDRILELQDEKVLIELAAQKAAKSASDQYDKDTSELDKRKDRIAELEKQLSKASKTSASSTAVSDAQRLQADAEGKLKTAEEERDRVAGELNLAKQEVKKLEDEAVAKGKLTTKQIQGLDERVRLAGLEEVRLTEELRLATERADKLDGEVKNLTALLTAEQKLVSEANAAKQKELDALREEHRAKTEAAQLKFDDQFKKEEQRVTDQVMLGVNANFARQVSDEVAKQVQAAVEKREREVIAAHQQLLIEAKAAGVREAQALVKQQLIDAKADGAREAQALVKQQLIDAKSDGAREAKIQLTADFEKAEQGLREKLAVQIVELITPLTYLVSADKPATRTDAVALLDGEIAGSKGPKIDVQLSDFLVGLVGDTVDLGELLDPSTK